MSKLYDEYCKTYALTENNSDGFFIAVLERKK